ncbi:alanine racemase, partial [Alphaproteobacteria bacterium]|nr:alanine racemase [Alphaproteobacteria bacterium]
ISVVKGDAYGHGMYECTKALMQIGCKKFYVANTQDSLTLREKYKNISIYVLSGCCSNQEIKTLYENNITPIVNNLDQLEFIKRQSKLINKKIKVVIHLDTGMNRLGFKTEDIVKIQEYRSYIEILFLMSHFTSADEKDLIACNKQLNLLIKSNNFFNKQLSIANSGGCFLNPKYHLDYVRPGKSLYGINPFIKKELNIKQVASLYSPILQVSNLDKNETVGYSKTFKTNKKIKTATINIGYANGYMRSGSDKATTYIEGYSARVLGRISMDLITIDVSKVPKNYLKLGQPVEILGNNINYEDLARSMNTNEHELLISLGFGNKKNYLI